MRFFSVPALALLSAASLGGCAALKAPGSVENAAARPVCLASYQIDNTTIPDDSTILFKMRDGSVWKNTLVSPCYGLRLDTRGFTYEATDPGSDTICSNLVTIRTNTDRNVCLLGAFTQVSPPHHA
jgi:hypothetical protein